jgi:hypothetical protein
MAGRVPAMTANKTVKLHNRSASRATPKLVMPAKAGIQYAAALRISRTSLEYWITRFRG